MPEDSDKLDDHLIEQMFRDIVPEDFYQDHTAIDEYVLAEPFTPDHFAAYIRSALNDWRQQYQQNRWHNQAQLFSDSRYRLFVAQPDETSEMFASRLAREARAMQANYAVVAVISPARHWFGEGNDPLSIDQNDEAAIEVALTTGELHMSICWTALLRDDTGITSSAGYSSLDGDRSAEGDFTDDNPYGRILEK